MTSPCICSGSVFTVRYELSLNGTALSARDEQSLNATAIASVMGKINTPQGTPYVTVATASMELESAVSCTTMALSRVVRTTDQEEVQTAVKTAILKSLTGKSMSKLGW